MYYYSQNDLNCRDSVYGTVVGGSKDGLFIRLDNTVLSDYEIAA